MRELPARIMTKLWYFLFALIHGPSFKSIGRGAFLFRPFRIDGADGIEAGEKTVMQRGGWLYCRGIDRIPASLKLGKGCVFGYNNHITAVREVVIGDYVLTANNVYISDNLHGYEDTSTPVLNTHRFSASKVLPRPSVSP